jgi:hypothetical protein
VYTRFSLWVAGAARRLGTLPVVEEVNTDDRAELPLWSPQAGLYNRLTRAIAARSRSGYVFLTPELARITGLARGTTPWCTISNGVDLDAFAELPAPANERPRAIFLTGTTSAWQGIDKVVRLAELCPSIDIDLVGGPAGLAGPSNLQVLPFTTGPELQRVVARADLALGTLGLHRKHMEEACPLKVREYLSYGIPTVVGYRDPDLLAMDERYVLQIENTEDNIERFAGKIAQFAETSLGVRVPRKAVQGLSSRAKELQRLEFLRAVVERGR